MSLKSLEISGFKSFAKKSVFEFNSPISSIVGPNGSGKSNVAEAFRFVLGEQSIKNMRGKKGEDLIWNGSNSEPRANRAMVRVVLDNSKGLFDVDFQEVAIERIVHRDGVNEYLLNGSTVRLKDILELLSKAHIGSSGHHIISQGEADRIVSATPKERKGMIEDALGLKLYQYRRLESEKKLEKTFENIAQVESLRREIAPHIKYLKKQVEKVEKTESLRGELLVLGQEYFKREDIYLSNEKRQLSLEKDPIVESRDHLAKELEKAKKVLSNEEGEEKRHEAVLNLEKSLSRVRESKDALSRELGRLEGLLDAENRILLRQKAAERSADQKTVRLSEVEELYREIESERDGEGLLQRIKTRILNFIKSRRETVDAEEMKEAESRIAKLMNEKSEVEKRSLELNASEEELLKEFEKEKKEIDEEKHSSREAERLIFKLMSEENELVAKLGHLEAREERLKYEEEEFKRDLIEVSHLVGQAVLRFKDFELAGALPLEEARSEQEARKRTLEKNKLRLEDTSLSGTEEIMKEYRDATERDEFLAKELLDLEHSAESLKSLIKELEERLENEFESGLEKINKEFNKLFNTMFDGGEAGLVLTKTKKPVRADELVEFLEEAIEEGGKVEEGLEIKVSLPRKKVRSLIMLSGGERALTSIALVFAVSLVNPPPFIILDETDAALDESNSRKYGDLVEMLAKHSQLILITHNRETMSRAGVIYGVTMGSNGVSKLLSISFDQAVEVAK